MFSSRLCCASTGGVGPPAGFAALSSVAGPPDSGFGVFSGVFPNSSRSLLGACRVFASAGVITGEDWPASSRLPTYSAQIRSPSESSGSPEILRQKKLQTTLIASRMQSFTADSFTVPSSLMYFLSVAHSFFSNFSQLTTKYPCGTLSRPVTSGIDDTTAAPPHHSTQRAHTSSTRPVIIAITPVTCLQPSAKTNNTSTQSECKEERKVTQSATHCHRMVINGSSQKKRTPKKTDGIITTAGLAHRPSNQKLNKQEKTQQQKTENKRVESPARLPEN
ncbi:hypothetical protein TCDM_09399 [Trypanosoma cruzi Dm28c]|uniref:Uncharacterized protein n=1 Tax=Trypanosoma cruzi Dm28c TaxID=1416333 RepID=V5AQ46_TRYCR|nr:hypothetical protein TCDM_09399 [Trypanosoma cruzi Dm28c]